MRYLESQPSAPLKAFVKCYWSLEYANAFAGDPEPVVPDGSMEIIFNLSDRFRRLHDDGSIETQPSSLVAGQMRTPVSIGPSGNVCLLGVRFKTAGAYPFFSFSLNELTDRIESLESVWGREARLIEGRIFDADGFSERVLIIEDFLLRRLARGSKPDQLLNVATTTILSQHGTSPIGSVIRELGTTERSLERRFREKIGLSPKMFSRIARFQRALRILEENNRADPLDTAFELGYFDQSHMINEFRQFSGSSPAAFLQNSHNLTGFFTTGS